MKKVSVPILVVLSLLGLATIAHSYSYTLTFISGGVEVGVGENFNDLSLATTDDLVVDLSSDAPPAGMQVDYSASVDLNLALFGFIGYNLILDDTSLGAFGSFELSDWIGDGTTDVVMAGSQEISGAFGGTSLTGATLDYDVTFSPDLSVSDRFAISIDELHLYGGNTDEVLAGLIESLNASGESPITLVPPFSIPTNITGSVHLEGTELADNNPVPLPSTLVLFGAGIIGLAGYRKRQTS